MRFFRANFLVLVLLAAIPVSFFVNRHDAKVRDRAQDVAAQHQRTKLVEGCVSNSRRTAFEANLAKQLHDRVSARGNPGDAEFASAYLADGLSLVGEIVATTPSPKIADVVRAGDRFKLTPEAAALQKAGCEARYAPVTK